MSKVIKIKTCRECPYVDDTRGDAYCYLCRRGVLKLDSIDSIPDDCPLEDWDASAAPDEVPVKTTHKIVLTAFHGLLESIPDDYAPIGDRLVLDNPFESFSISIGDDFATDSIGTIPEGMFRKTGRILDGAEEWALAAIRH